jgi:hypothetical protein
MKLFLKSVFCFSVGAGITGVSTKVIGKYYRITYHKWILLGGTVGLVICLADCLRLSVNDHGLCIQFQQ